MHRFLRSRGRLLGLLTFVGLTAAGCASDAQQTTLEPKGPLADKIDGLWNLTLLIAVVVFVFVEFGVLFVVWKFRARKDDDPSALPKQLHGNTKAEIGWTALPAVILAFLAVATVTTILDLAEKPDEALEVRVVGQQWWWSYDYDVDGDGIHPDNDVNAPGIENPEEYASDIETASELVIPVGKPVYLEIESRDVIHSFWIPALNGKKDAVPGRTHHLRLEAAEAGTFVGQCTEFCGLSHAYMRMTVRALAPADYEAWVEAQLAEAAEPQTAAEKAGQELFAARCASCHLVEGLNDEGYNGALQVSGAAPNLTHFADRGVYAGAIFDLWKDQDDDGVIEVSEIGVEADRNQLEAWLRNPPGEKPLYAQGNRGMPNLGLNESEIDSLVAYLLSLG